MIVKKIKTPLNLMLYFFLLQGYYCLYLANIKFPIDLNYND
jgi:hypothetical protein